MRIEELNQENVEVKLMRNRNSFSYTSLGQYFNESFALYVYQETDEYIENINIYHSEMCVRLLVRTYDYVYIFRFFKRSGEYSSVKLSYVDYDAIKSMEV